MRYPSVESERNKLMSQNPLVRTPGGTIGRVIEVQKGKRISRLLELPNGQHVWVHGPVYPVKNPLLEAALTGLGFGAGLMAAKSVFKNPDPPHLEEALEARTRYKSDVKAGHTAAAEYWRGQAGAYFTANPSRETIPGTKRIAIRIVNAENRFIEFAMRTGDLSQEQAEKVLAVYKKHRAIKIDKIGGQFTFTHGDFAERDVIRRTAGIKTANPLFSPNTERKLPRANPGYEWHRLKEGEAVRAADLAGEEAARPGYYLGKADAHQDSRIFSATHPRANPGAAAHIEMAKKYKELADQSSGNLHESYQGAWAANLESVGRSIKLGIPNPLAYGPTGFRPPRAWFRKMMENVARGYRKPSAMTKAEFIRAVARIVGGIWARFDQKTRNAILRKYEGG